MYPTVSENQTVAMTETFFTMRDGVKLYTRIVSPRNAEKTPIVFIRTPYEASHNGEKHDINAYTDNLFIKNGYSIILQHCRGRGDSEGICIPYINEKNDGLDTLEQIRELSIYNGEIYLFGESYLVSVHLCYISEKPRDIKGAVFNIQTDRMYFRNYRNGCNYDLCNLNWWISMIKRQYPNQNTENAIKRPYIDVMKRIIGEDFPYYNSHLLNDKYNDFWQSDPRTYATENIEFPVLFLEGWYDFYNDCMFSMWERLPEETRKKSVFFAGPWGHSTRVTPLSEYPIKNGNLPSDYAVKWFDSIRKNTKYEYSEAGKLNYYSLVGATWKSADYPFEYSKTKRLYFNKNNALTDLPCTEDHKISYVYDPDKKVDCFKYQSIYKAHEIDSIDGIVSFVSEPAKEESSFRGKVRWRINVSTDCEDTAFYMRVYFVENGTAYNLTETITSLSHISSSYRSGNIIEIDIVTPPIAWTMKEGMQIRVDISSNGGIYLPHANVKGHWAEVTECKIANNTLHIKDSFIELLCE